MTAIEFTRCSKITVLHCCEQETILMFDVLHLVIIKSNLGYEVIRHLAADCIYVIVVKWRLRQYYYP